MSLRVRRLENERRLLDEAFGRHPHIRVRSVLGEPPEKYEVTFSIKGLERRADGALVIRTSHQIEVSLPAEYPRLPAACRMLTPVFHPNIDISTVCTSDFHAAQETLVDLIVRIGQMIAFQKHNVKSPLNAEAARWCEQNLARLPVDPADLHPLERSR
jgi:ubiquitin-protein ligase